MSQMAHKTPKQVLESLAHDIATVLKSMGGSAHQNMVVECVAAMKRQRGEAVNPPDLRQKIIETFEYYRDWFVRPFGEGSQRWALAGDFG
ncbi:Uncharacterised protein [Brevundimonas vesicularis]|uniref:Uncharacterized protein n=1 Tax=Brevundimonas vesicularis TaxID=41276 RepID=A0A2X1CNQ0_BREVE|nr:hypothetical protein [Brevundimonas vesicularis]SPU55841.1 Uncharacterised protein [Brevundimonas vesicularis]